MRPQPYIHTYIYIYIYTYKHIQSAACAACCYARSLCKSSFQSCCRLRHSCSEVYMYALIQKVDDTVPATSQTMCIYSQACNSCSGNSNRNWTIQATRAAPCNVGASFQFSPHRFDNRSPANHKLCLKFWSFESDSFFNSCKRGLPALAAF